MHPLSLFTYCPRCGAKAFLPHDERSSRCTQCGFTYYLNPSTANVGVIWNRKGQLLAVRRAIEPMKGWLDLPGGFCDLHETAEEGVRREVMEETGLRVTDMRFLLSQPNTYEYSGFTVHTIDLFFLCSVDETAAPQAMDDAQEIVWLWPEEVRPEVFAFESTKRALHEILQNRPINKV